MTTAQVTFPTQMIRRRRDGRLMITKHQPQQQAVRMSFTDRVANYLDQSPGRPITPRQGRRLRHKIDHHHTPKG